MQFRLSDVLLDRLDALAALWGVSRSGAVRRLIERADVDGMDPLPVPSMDRVVRIAVEGQQSLNTARTPGLSVEEYPKVDGLDDLDVVSPRAPPRTSPFVRRPPVRSAFRLRALDPALRVRE